MNERYGVFNLKEFLRPRGSRMYEALREWKKVSEFKNVIICGSDWALLWNDESPKGMLEIIEHAKGLLKYSENKFYENQPASQFFKRIEKEVKK